MTQMLDNPPVTLVQIARHSGVSHSTVSRVLNGRPNIAEATRRKVMAVVHKQGMALRTAPLCLNARSAPDSRPADARLTVEVVLCQLSPHYHQMREGYFMSLVRGCDQAARADGNLEWRWSWSEQAESQALERRLARRPNAGAVLMGHVDAAMVRRLREQGAQVVLASQEVPGLGVDGVSLDNFAGGLKAARHLLRHGYRRIGWLGGPEREADWTQRLAGVRAGLAEAELLMRDRDCRDPAGEDLSRVRIETYEQAVRDWFDEGDLPQALILPCAMLASVVQRVMLEKRLHCPDDLAMVCFDDDLFVSLCGIAPTRLDSRPRMVGQKAMERLIYLLRHPEAESSPQKILIPVQLIPGESVGRRLAATDLCGVSDHFVPSGRGEQRHERSRLILA